MRAQEQRGKRLETPRESLAKTDGDLAATVYSHRAFSHRSRHATLRHIHPSVLADLDRLAKNKTHSDNPFSEL